MGAPWWASLIGLSSSDDARDAQERTESSRVERGSDNLGRTERDSENDDPNDSCGGGDGDYGKDD